MTNRDSGTVNQTDYAKEKRMTSAILDKELDRLRQQDIRYQQVVVPYSGNEVWRGLKGKKLLGHKAATEYAKKLSELMNRMLASAVL